MEPEVKGLNATANLLSKTKLHNKDTITSKNVFQTVGGNSFIQIEPPVAKFSGFQLNRDNKMLIRIINKAPIPQRLHILPPTSSFFTIKVDKKGILSTGMSETIELHFEPTEYRYYNQMLRINTETENFVVPIHAYPVLTTGSLREVFPKLIDFGTIDIGQTQTNTYPIRNKVPLDFEFQIEYKKPNPNISIEPMSGVIPSQGLTQVVITFAPNQKVTSVAEFILRVSQFDFEPLFVRIVGNGREKPKKKDSKIRIKPGSAKQQRSQTPLNNPSQVNATQQQMQHSAVRGRSSFRNTQTIHKQTLKPIANFNSSIPLTSNISGVKQIVSQRKHLQREFLQRYNEVYGLDKEKDIKFFIYNGDKPMTSQQITKVGQERKNNRQAALDELQRGCNSLYSVAFNSQQPVIERQIFIQKTPTYDIEKNDEMSKRRKLLKRLMAAGSRILVRNRMLNRLSKIKQFLMDCPTRQHVAKKVHQDHLAAGEKHSSGEDYVKFTFQLSTSSFASTTFPLQFEDSGPMSSKPFQIKAQPNFDDLAVVDLIQQSEVDVMNYTAVSTPLGIINLPKQTPSLRQSAEQQNAFKGPGVPTIDKIKRSLVMELPQLIPSHIFIAQDAQIKKFSKQIIYDQKDIEYLWQDKAPIEDELVGWESGGDRQVLRAKFMRNLGCQLSTQNGFVNSELDVDVGNYEKIHKYCPKFLEGKLPDDPFSDADSDNDDYPTVPPTKLQDLSKKVQGDVKSLQQKRQTAVPINEYSNVLSKMQRNAEQIKRKLLATSLTKISDSNKWAIKTSTRLPL